jgi:general secretion pathway protein K
MMPSGTTVNANTIDETTLLQLLRWSGIDEPDADSLVDALLDWRDNDDEARPYGAEQEWYVAKRRVPPRNASFQTDEEIALVRGWSIDARPPVPLGTDSTPIVVDRASPVVLSTLPGLSSEAIRWIDEHRESLRGRDVSAAIDGLQQADRSLLLRHYAELRQRTRVSPSFWQIEIASANAAHFRLRLKLSRDGTHLRVEERREYTP